MKRVVLSIPGIYTSCPTFNIANIEHNLRKLEGVKDVKIKGWKVHINYYSSKVSIDEIKKAIDKMGYVVAEQG